MAFFISSNFSPVPKSLLNLLLFLPLCCYSYFTTPPTLLTPLPLFFLFFYPFGAALARALRYFQTLAGCGMSQGCRRLYTLAPLLPFFFRAPDGRLPGGRLCPRRPPHHGRGMCPVRSHADAQLFASICQDGMGAPLLHRLERRNEVHRLAVSAAYRVGWCCPSFLDSGSTAVVGLGPHRVEHTPSRPIWAVKQRRARLVLAWVTGWESRVSKPPGIAHFASLPLLFFFRPLFFARS